MSWSDHITRVTNKAGKRLDTVKRIKSFLPRHTLSHLYKCLIRPILEYGAVIFNNCTQADSLRLESIQRSAALICTGAYQRTESSKLLDELGWETLQSRRYCQTLVYFYKIRNGLSPDYLSSILPQQHGEINQYNTRNRNKYIPYPTRTKKFYSSFVNFATRAWNKLPDYLKTLPTLHGFKMKLRNIYVPSHNHLFCIGNNSGHKNHTRIRLGLSGLNYQRFTYNLIENGNCTHCTHLNVKEDAIHFFFDCSKYVVLRGKLVTELTSLCNIDISSSKSKKASLRILLFGHPELHFEDNVKLFKIVNCN